MPNFREPVSRRPHDPVELVPSFRANLVASAAWVLAADASRFVTGQTPQPDGGIAMP